MIIKTKQNLRMAKLLTMSLIKIFAYHHCRYELGSLTFGVAHSQYSLKIPAALATLPEKLFAKWQNFEISPKKGLTMLRMANTISVTRCCVKAIVDFADIHP
jgi:hypothetical protein